MMRGVVGRERVLLFPCRLYFTICACAWRWTGDMGLNDTLSKGG